MPTDTPDLNLTFQEKSFAVTCVALVATYAGFALNARRQLKKSLAESSARYAETSTKIAEAMDTVKQKSTDI